MDINDLLKESFENWLKTLGYAQSTIYGSVHYVGDFFFYLKNNGIAALEEITPGAINAYFDFLQKRKNKRSGGALSANTIIGNLDSIKRLARYLQESGKPGFEISPKLKAEKANTVGILTKAEIQALYRACTSGYLGLRDRAMLGIFYGCGLRRSEGLALGVKDILLKEKRVFVRKGKNYRERYVPMTGAVKEDLEAYIATARQKILSFKPGNTQQALFLSIQGKRISGNGMMERLKKLLQEANNLSDGWRIQKDAGLHTLRHSIATHLLQSGLGLEEIKQFLGHASLETTQIYTHIANEI